MVLKGEFGSRNDSYQNVLDNVFIHEEDKTFLYNLKKHM